MKVNTSLLVQSRPHEWGTQLNNHQCIEAPNVVSIRLEPDDVIAASITVRTSARRLGFSPDDQARIAKTAVELSQYGVRCARTSQMTVHHIVHDNQRGLELVFEYLDAQGFGIHGVTNSGDGSPFAPRSLMDEFVVEAAVGGPTRVTCRKWLP